MPLREPTGFNPGTGDGSSFPGVNKSSQTSGELSKGNLPGIHVTPIRRIWTPANLLSNGDQQRISLSANIQNEQFQPEQKQNQLSHIEEIPKAVQIHQSLPELRELSEQLKSPALGPERELTSPIE